MIHDKGRGLCYESYPHEDHAKERIAHGLLLDCDGKWVIPRIKTCHDCPFFGLGKCFINSPAGV